MNNSPGHAIPLARYKSLDMWRGLACLLVVFLHGAIYRNMESWPAHDPLGRIGNMFMLPFEFMFVGVPMFFVISGYCIAATADSTRRNNFPRADYFKRRLRRIFPPFWAALALTCGITLLAVALGGDLLRNYDLPGSGFVPHPSSLSVVQWIGNLTLTEHWRFHLIDGPEKSMLFPSWTLCYEEQFYVVCGLLLVFAARRFFVGVVCVTLLTLATTLLAWKFNWPISGYFFDGGWLQFAAGVFVFYHVNYSSKTNRWLVPAGLVLAILILGVLRFGVFRHGTSIQQKPLLDHLEAAVFAWVILALYSSDRWLCELRVLKPLAWCGRMCYSLYLIHWPVTKLLCAGLYTLGVKGTWPTLLVTVPLSTAVSLAAAWVFHLLVERRFLNPVARLPTFAPAPVPVPVAVS